MKTRADNPPPSDSEHRPKRYSRWRALTLAGVYVLMGVHIAHWKIAGKTLAPLELNEVMHTLELGIVTAGFIFMCVAVLSVLVFGRFFCGWGCHILALEDLCAWMLAKIGIRPKPIRARALLLVPVGAVLYMFVWPQVARLIEGSGLPVLRVTGDESGWASFLTDDFARNLPGPGVTVLTFVVVGFVMVYFLGTRSFCRYACPYGAVFAVADRVAPGGIVARGDCSSCGLCTAQCQSNIRVHEELTVFGRVVSPSCLKDLDCVAACPDGSIGYGFSRPSLFRSWKRVPGVKRPRYDFTLAEEGLMIVVFFIVLFTFRGLYGLIPFLLSLALGGILAYGAVTGVRLIRSVNVRLNNFQLKRSGRLSRSGWCVAGAVVLVAALTAHSAFIRYHEHLGWRAANRLHEQHAGGADSGPTIDAALGHLSIARRWGLYVSPALDAKILELRLTLAEREAMAGRMLGAIDLLRETGVRYPDSALLHYNLGVLLASVGREAEAMAEYERTTRLDPLDALAWNNLGFLHLRAGRLDDAERVVRRAIELDPEFANASFNLACIMAGRDRPAEADEWLHRAAELDAAYARFLTNPDDE